MKKLTIAMCIISIFTINAETVDNHTYRLKVMNIDGSSLIVDKSGQQSSEWIFDHYEYRNQSNPIETSISQYAPVIDEQLADFTQIATRYSYYTQDKVTIEKNGLNQLRESAVVNETVNAEDEISRTVNVSVGEWSAYGGLSNCSQWDVPEETVSSGTIYTKNRTCDKTDIRVVGYSTGGQNIINKEQFNTIQVTDSIETSGTKSPENLSPGAAAGKVQLYSASQTVHSGYNTLSDGSLFNGNLTYQSGKCANLYAGSGYNYIRFTVTEPLYLSVATSSLSGVLKVGTAVNGTALAQVNSINNQLVTLGALLQPGTNYYLWTTGDIFVCELGAAQ